MFANSLVCAAWRTAMWVCYQQKEIRASFRHCRSMGCQNTRLAARSTALTTVLASSAARPRSTTPNSMECSKDAAFKFDDPIYAD